MKESQSLILEIKRYIDGDDTAGDMICKTLEAQVRASVRRLIGPHDADGDDVIQDTLIAMLGYLRRAKVAPDNPEAFIVTIARNRCRNLHLWRRRRSARDVTELSEKLPHIAASPLDLIDEEQRRELLEEVLQNLDTHCRDLLAAIYRQGATIEELRHDLGLGSVQAVYHRRNVCIKKAQMLLNRRLFSGQTFGGRKPRSRTTPCLDKESADG